MDQPKIQKPTEAELEILQILWENQPNSVRYVNDRLNTKREVGYTTTLKMMQNMLEKGMLSREIQEKIHLYRATESQANTQTLVIRNVVENVFGGSASSLVMRALGSGQATAEELNQIKELIDKIEKSENK
jgi:BlaI family transcriptional regulator, penicillinase repressor